jgi:hypothetical protein
MKKIDDMYPLTYFNLLGMGKDKIFKIISLLHTLLDHIPVYSPRLTPSFHTFSSVGLEVLGSGVCENVCEIYVKILSLTFLYSSDHINKFSGKLKNKSLQTSNKLK